MASPTSTVFNVSELLEYILLYLSPLEIVKARSVCTFWRSCILSSNRLLTAAWLVPPSTRTAFVTKRVRDRTNFSDYLEIDHIHPLIIAQVKRALPMDSTPDSRLARTFELYGAQCMVRCPETLIIASEDRGIWDSLLGFAKTYEASRDEWGQLSITRPPITCMYLRCKKQLWESTSVNLKFQEEGSQLTLMHFFEGVKILVRSLNSPSERPLDDVTERRRLGDLFPGLGFWGGHGSLNWTTVYLG